MTNDAVGCEAGDESAQTFWDELATLLLCADHFSTMYDLEPLEVLRAWAALEGESPHRVMDSYAAAIRDPVAGAAYGPGLPALLHARGHCGDATKALFRELVVRARSADDPQSLADRLGEYVEACRGDERRAVNDERLELCRRVGDVAGEAEVLCDEAWCRWFDGLLDEDPDGERDSRRLLRELRLLCHRHGLTRGLALWADATAWLLFCDGWPRPMRRLFAMEERWCRQCGDLELLCVCLLERARILRVVPDTRAKAWAKMQEAEVIARELGLARLVRAAVTDQGVAALVEGDEARSLALLRGVRARPAEGDSESSLEASLRQALEFPDDSVRSLTECFARDFARGAERVARELGDAGAVQWALGRQATSLQESDPSAALELCGEQEAIQRDLGRGLALAQTLRMKADLLACLSRPTEALVALGEEAAVCDDYALTWRLADVRRGQRDALRAALRTCGDLDLAAALQQELELVCRWLGDRAGASLAVRDRARILRRLHPGSRVMRIVDPSQLTLDELIMGSVEGEPR